MERQPVITTALWQAREDYLTALNEYTEINNQLTPLLDEIVNKNNIKKVLGEKGVVTRFEDLYLASDEDAQTMYKKAHELFLSLGYDVEMHYSPILIANTKQIDASHKFIDESFYLVKDTGLKQKSLYYNIKAMREYLRITLNMLDKLSAISPTPKALQMQIAYRFNTTEDKVSNIQIDDEHGCVTADIEDVCTFCNCGFIEDYGVTLEEYKEKIK